MKPSNRSTLTFAHHGIAAWVARKASVTPRRSAKSSRTFFAIVALACGAALVATGAQAAISFETINDPADQPFPPPPATGGVTFTNLMGINSSGNLIAGFYGSGAAGDPNTGFLLTLPSKTFTPDNFHFPGQPNFP